MPTISSRSPRHSGTRVWELFKRHVDDLVGRQLGVDRVHIGPVHHDVGDRQLAQVEHAAQHVAVELHHAAFLVVQLDGAAQISSCADSTSTSSLTIDAEQPQGVAHQELHGGGHRREHRHDRALTIGATASAMRSAIDDGVGLGQHLGEHHHQHRHHHGGIGDAGIAEEIEQQAGRQRRGGDIGEVVAEQDRADQPLAGEQQAVDDAGAVVAILFQGVHAGARRRGQRRLRAGEEGRDDQQAEDGAKRNAQAQRHGRRTPG